MISFGNAASSHSGLIPLKTAYKKNFFINFFINSTISRSIVKKDSLQVTRTLKTGKAFKQGLKHNQFLTQILCLQVSGLIIHWHCFHVSYAPAQLAKKKHNILCYDFMHLQRLYRAVAGGLPYERGGDARRLAYGCKFQILVLLRVFWAKHHYIQP